jgi:hypothetical protein
MHETYPIPLDSPLSKLYNGIYIYFFSYFRVRVSLQQAAEGWLTGGV